MLRRLTAENTAGLKIRGGELPLYFVDAAFSPRLLLLAAAVLLGTLCWAGRKMLRLQVRNPPTHSMDYLPARWP